MKIDNYISDLRNNKNIIIAVLNDEIKIRGDKQALTQELIAEIKSKKEEILAYFKSLKGYELAEQIPTAPEEEYNVLSAAQRRLYFIHELQPESVAYNQPIFVTLIGNVDKQRLDQIFNELVVRHEILRTSFVNIDGEVYQKINAPNHFEIEHFTSNESCVNAIIENFIRPFDLQNPCLLRVGLIEVSSTEYVLLTDAHHVISDGVSQGILISEFVSLYSHEQLPDLRLQYKDYAHWQVSEANRELLSKKKQFWLKQFEGDLPLLDLPTDKSRPAVKSNAGDTVEFGLSASETLQLKNLAEKKGTTMFTALLAVFYVLLYKLSGQEDIVIGTPTAGREHLDLEAVIGVFVNTLALRNYPKGAMSFGAFLADVKATTLACFDNQAYQYEELINELKVPRDQSRNPLFDTIFTYQNYEQSEIKLSELTLKPFKNVHSESLCDMHITAFEVYEVMEFNFTYPTELYERETIVRFSEYFKRIVTTVIENEEISLSKIDITSEEEQHRILHEFNQTQVSYPNDETIVSLFEKQAKKTPDNIAVLFKDKSVTYTNLKEKSDQIACYLKNILGIKKGDLVGLMMDREEYLMPVIFGILKAGAAYVPISPEYPIARINTIIDDAKLSALITRENHISEAIIIDASKLIDLDNVSTEIGDQDVKSLNINVASDSLAYVIYTSGSTGKPKGVMVKHKSVINRILWMQKEYPLTESDVLLQKTPIVFDVSVWELFWWSFTGASLRLLQPGEEKSPQKILDIIKEDSITTIHFVPSMFDAFLLFIGASNYSSLKSLRQVFTSGEALKPAHLKQFEKKIHAHFGTRLINLYGPTEATVDVSFYECDFTSNVDIVPIGKPIDNIRLYIVDTHERSVPMSVSGELCIAGIGLAQGYLNNQELTNKSFVHLDGINEEFVYKTGDLARWLTDGNIEYLGRIDHQVKIRGFRIELGEIEYHLLSHHQINQTVVIPFGDEGSKYLIGYYVAAAEIDDDVLKNYLEQHLPEYMVPQRFVCLEEMPLTTTGKINKKMLPAPETATAKYEAPRNNQEQIMVNVWSEVLSVNDLGIKDNFFSLGGDSIKAIKLIYKINEMLESDLSVSDLYGSQTIEELSAVLPLKSGRGKEEYLKAEAEVESFQKWYQKEVGFQDSFEAVYPMSSVEKGMTFYTLLNAQDEQSFHNILYHEQNVYHMEWENFSFDILKKAILLLTEKHSSLRKIYDIDNFAHIVKKQIEPELHYIDISHLPLEERIEFGAKKMNDERVKSTDFSGNVPLWRMNFIKTTEDFHYMLFDMHHSVFDGWSLHAFLTELKNTYIHLEKDPNYQLVQLECNYRDHIISEIKESNDPLSNDYWRNEMEGYTRYKFVQTSKEHRYITKIYQLEAELRQDLESLARKLNSSLKNLCFAAYVYTLSKLNYSNDITIGTITNNRPLVPDGEKLLGCFLNTVPLRVQIPKEGNWTEYLDYINNKLIKLKEHERIPFAKILEIIDEPVTNENPIFDFAFNYIDFWIISEMLQHDGEPAIDSDSQDLDFATDNNDVNQNTLCDFHVVTTSNIFEVIMEYSTTIVDEVLADKIFGCFKNTLKQFVYHEKESIHSNSILAEDEKNKLLFDFNKTAVPFSKEENLSALFQKQAQKSPNEIAIIFENGTITYKQLEDKMLQIASYLIEVEGVVAGDLVGLMLDRDELLIPSILAILKAGAAYVSLDPSHPVERTNLIIEDAKLRTIITSKKCHSDSLRGVPSIVDLDIKRQEIESRPIMQFDTKVSGNELAYVIYTSGSTGKPKGVMVEHKSIVNLIEGLEFEIPYSQDSTILCLTTVAFDIFASESLFPLIKGFKLVMASEQQQQDGALLINAIKKHNIDILQITPSRLELLLSIEHPEVVLSAVKTLMLTGEVFPQALLSRLKNSYKGAIFNLYGPTETTVFSTIKNLTYEDTVTIGQPLVNTNIHILDENHGLLSIGTPGELCIGGDGLARGYLGNQALTSEKYIDHPFEKERLLYKTGDLARWLPNGDIEFLGRIDYQVKIRGFRIELGEIESKLHLHDKINQAVVLDQDMNGEKFLVAYYTADEEIDTTDLRSYLGNKLPDYMVPSYFVLLDHIPLSPSGKIDRRSIPKKIINSDEDFESPSGSIEEKLAEMWSKILKLNKEDIGATKNFFELGGHSLRAMVLINLISKEFSRELSVGLLFQMPTIRGLAQFLAAVHIPEKKVASVNDQEEFTF
jgi:amino acid adenylation domain-containing protein